MAGVYLSLGSNLGDREQNLRAAVSRLESPRLRVARVSSIYETVHHGGFPPDAPDYLNCVLMAETDYSPEELLAHAQKVEREVGRVPAGRWAPRVIDIDILLFEGVSRESDDLLLPHPGLLLRAFVLVPLAEIAPNLTLPDGASAKDHVARPAIQAQSVRRYKDW